MTTPAQALLEQLESIVVGLSEGELPDAERAAFIGGYMKAYQTVKELDAKTD